MKRLIAVTIAICSASLGFSQTDFRKGFVITSASDTLFGLVDYREGGRAYRISEFKEAKSQNSITYEPSDIIGYGFANDKFFLSRDISINDQPPNVVFLEVIVRGLVTLYKFEQSYFIEKESSGLQQLVNEQEEVYVDGKLVLRSKNQHISIMNMLLFDCVDIRNRLNRTRLNQKAITRLIEDYNKCKGEPSVTFKVKKPWTKLIAGITSGVNISNITFPANTIFEHLTGHFETSKSPAIGISLDILSPRLSERISFHGDLLYLSSTYYNYNTFNTGYSANTNYVTIQLQQLKIPFGIRYTFPRRTFTSYFNVGASSTLHLKSSSNWIQEVEGNGVVRTYWNDALTIKKNQIGFWGGLGVTRSIHNKLDAFIEFRFEQTDGISDYFIVVPNDFQSSIINYQIMIGIRTR